LRDSSLYVISCIRQPVVQELDDNRIQQIFCARKTCRPTSGVDVLLQLKQSRYSASTELVFLYIRSMQIWKSRS